MTDRDRSATGGRLSVDERAVRERVVADHADALDAVAAAADAAAGRTDGPPTDGQALAAALERALADAGALERLPAVLKTGVAAAGLELAADPVAAPPYVTVTSRGPVLRGSTDAGRLVVVLRAFRVERDPVRYVRTGGDPPIPIDVRFER